MKHHGWLLLTALLLAPSLSAAPVKDPKIVALAAAAAKCKFEDGYFDEECKAYKAWSDEEKLFADGKGDATILAMLEDADVRTRALAASKGFDDFDRLVADKANATRVIAAAKKETEPGVAQSFGNYVARVDLEKQGFEADLKALAKHPVGRFREGLGFHLYATKQTPLRLEVTKTLLADADAKVQMNALQGLSMGASRGKAPEACTLLGAQISRPEGDALWQIGTSRCTSIFDALATEALKRANDPAMAAKEGVGLSLAMSSMCRDGNAAQKTKGFAASKALTSTNVKNVNVRSAGMRAAVECDATASKPLLTALLKDADKGIAKQAAESLAKLDKP